MDVIYFKIFKSSKEDNKLIKLIEVFNNLILPRTCFLLAIYS